MLKLIYRGKRKYLCFILAGVILLAFVVMHHRDDSRQVIKTLAYQNIAFNFDPENRNVNPSGLWIYNMKTKKLHMVGSELTYESDCDFQDNKVLGWIDSDVVEVDIESGETTILCRGTWDDVALIPFTLKYRPGSLDFSGLTNEGELVLWEREKGEFRSLAWFDWNGWSFSYSWAGDGTMLFVPDKTGIATIDLNTLTQNHWLTLPITYPVPLEHVFSPYYRKSFEVAKDGTCVVYRNGSELRFVEVTENGDVSETVVLDQDVGAQCGFSIAPDSKTIVFTMTRDKKTLFLAYYYEVWLYDKEKLVKILNSYEDINGEVSVFW